MKNPVIPDSSTRFKTPEQIRAMQSNEKHGLRNSGVVDLGTKVIGAGSEHSKGLRISTTMKKKKDEIL